MEIELTVSKAEVMREVAVTTAYTGGKMADDADALHRISTVEEDEAHLERFWEECRAEICQELIGLVATEEEVAGKTSAEIDYVLTLGVSSSFDDAMLKSMEISLKNYLVMNIAAKWYVYTNKGEAGAYADKAALMLEDVKRKAYYKKKPKRPTYDD